MEQELKKGLLFDVNGDDSKEKQEIFGGNPTGILNLNNIKYKWVGGLLTVMMGNHWIPQKTSLAADKISIRSLTEHEDKGVRDTLGFLIFLDSMQVNNLPNIADYITCSGCKTLLTVQAFQESIHSQSYQYILESLYPENERNKIYETWRENKLLLERNKFIAGQMQAFVDKPTKLNMKKVQIANLALEGIYFYQGFNLFDQLSSRKKLVQTQKMIDYIRTDENSHVALFTNLINETMEPATKDRQMVIDIFGEATEQEIKWSQETYGNRILGISEESSKQFIQSLTNRRLRGLRIDPMYPDAVYPYSHLEVQERSNYFEVSANTSYSSSSTVSGWDTF